MHDSFFTTLTEQIASRGAFFFRNEKLILFSGLTAEPVTFWGVFSATC